MTAVLDALLIGYLPGALLFRLPYWSRERRAALPGDERGFWHVMISLGWSLGLVLLLAAFDAYTFARLVLVNGGQTAKYQHAAFGVNSRLDEIQAAVLRVRLARLPAWTARRREIAARYRSTLIGSATIVPPERDAGHVYHLFPVRSASRTAFQSALAADGIDTLVHYPIALNRQDAFARHRPAPCPAAERACDEVCSLPLHPFLGDADVDAVAEAVNRFDSRS